MGTLPQNEEPHDDTSLTKCSLMLLSTLKLEFALNISNSFVQALAGYSQLHCANTCGRISAIAASRLLCVRRLTTQLNHANESQD